MNKNDRKQISELKEKLEEIMTEIESIAESEDDKFSNLPDGLQLSEKGQKIEESAGELYGISTELESLVIRLSDLIEE